MAVVPDFDEVSEEVSAEHLLRLASAIEHARKQGNLTSCIFTGTAAGVGVTTLATRVRDVLEAMGRPTVLLDSSGTPPPPSRASSQNGASGEPASQRGSRSTALLRKVTAETETRQESLVLTDTAPLPISAETEYLARFVDCAIVVVESGTTTRAQLLAALNTLQRLDVAAVGFVLNRVKLAQADPAFRRSVQDIDEHHRTLSMSTVRRTERTSQVAEELSPPVFRQREFNAEGFGA
jgi:Mrp family chromosome partitioning ATPase